MGKFPEKGKNCNHIITVPKASGRAAMESFVIYMIFNYFVQSLLGFYGTSLFKVDFAQEVGGTSGLTTIAGIKTLDMSVIGAIMIAAIVVWIHNRWYEKKLPGALSSFQDAEFRLDCISCDNFIYNLWVVFGESGLFSITLKAFSYLFPETGFPIEVTELHINFENYLVSQLSIIWSVVRGRGVLT